MSKVSRPILAIDYDGVIVDNIPYWDRYFSQGNCGESHAVVYDPTDWDRYPKLCKKCWRKVLHSPEMTYAIPPREDAKYVLPILARTMDLWLVTSRPESSSEWVKNTLFWHGVLQNFVGTVFTNDKKSVCESLGAFALVDDAVGNLEPLIGSSVLPIVWDAPYNQGLKGLWRVKDWAEVAQLTLELATGCVPAK